MSEQPTSESSAPSKSGMKVILIAQQKGGVGKTTLSRMLAVFGAREDLMNKRVLCIDFDSQGNLSKLLIDMDGTDGVGTRPPRHPDYDPKVDTDWTGVSSAADIFGGAGAVPYPIMWPYPIDNLQLLPAYKEGFQEVEEKDRTHLREKVILRLLEWLSTPDVQSLFDIVIIDTGPKDSPLVRTSLRAATHMIIPVTLERQCMDGLSEMLALWNLERQARPKDRPLVLAGLVVNKFDARYATHQSYLQQLTTDENVSAMMCPVIIPQRASVVERDSRGAKPATLFDLPKSSGLSEIAHDLCCDLYSKVFPEEAKRLAKIKPDRKYAQMAESRTREAAAAVATDAVTQGA